MKHRNPVENLRNLLLSACQSRLSLIWFELGQERARWLQLLGNGIAALLLVMLGLLTFITAAVLACPASQRITLLLALGLLDLVIAGFLILRLRSKARLPILKDSLQTLKEDAKALLSGQDDEPMHPH